MGGSREGGPWWEIVCSSLFARPQPTGAPTKKGELFQYDGPLSEVDPEVANIISHEKARQVRAQPAM